MASKLNNFLNYLSNRWEYSLPSNNLWVLDIKLHNDGSSDDNNVFSLSSLYSNIQSVNNKYKNSRGTSWGVGFGNTSMEEGTPDVTSFTTDFDDGELGLFLTQKASYGSNSITTNVTDSNINNMRGFMLPGEIVNSRNTFNSKLKVSLLSTNIDINDIFIDKWIAAIGQQGLIESSDLPNIKSDIFLKHYARSKPDVDTSDWVLRKHIKFIKSFPTQKSDTQLGYTNANTTLIDAYDVTFSYNDYTILY